MARMVVVQGLGHCGPILMRMAGEWMEGWETCAVGPVPLGAIGKEGYSTTIL